MNCDPSKACPICDQRGMPILPLRYAVARSDEGVKDKAPQLVAPFGDGVQEIGLPSDVAHYTLRLLRPGYLYVFNEVRGEWKGYVVNDNGYLVEFDIHSKNPPDVSDAQPCERMQNSAAGRCVMIPDAARAGAVWLGFSDTAWTAAVFDKNRYEASRRTHMQRIDVGAWARAKSAPETQPHLQRLDKLGELVCEFSLPAPREAALTPVHISVHAASNAGRPADERTILLPPISVRPYPALDYSLHDYCNQQRRTENEVQTATLAAGEFVPAMVALNDPVGITMELARLPGFRLEEFIADADPRPLVVSSAIENIRNAIMEDAENRQIYRTEREARALLDGSYADLASGGTGARAGQALADWLFPEQAKKREELFESWRNPSAADLRSARNDTWAKYARKYQEPQRAAWMQQWGRVLRQFDQAVIEPLVRAHMDWMRSAALCEWFDCNHDDEDAHSGQGFVDALTFCIQDTQQYGPCGALYSEWLAATSVERSNLVLRAVAWNQQQVIDSLNAFSQGGLRPDALKGLPWDGLIKGYEEAVTALADGGKNAVVRLAAALGGPIAEVAGKAVDGIVGPGLVALGAIAKAPVEMVDVVMSKADAIAELTARMVALNPEVGDLRSLNRAIDIQMRKAKIYGAPVSGTGRFRYLLMADPQVIADFPGVDSAGKAVGRRFAEQAILTEADRMRLTQLRWRKILPTSAGLGVITGILQVVALGKLADDVDQGMAHEENENLWRYRSGVTALAGTLAETAGKWSESAVGAGNRLARSMERHIGKMLRISGKALGIGAGVVMAVWDGARGVQELQEGNTWVGAMYIGSAVGAGVVMLAFSGWGALIFGTAATGVGIVLVVLIIVVAVLIEMFKDDKFQDWLERSYFGTFDRNKRYPDLEDEMQQLAIAMKG